MGEGGGKAWGGAALEPHPLGGPRARGHRSPSPAAGIPARRGYQPCQPASPSFVSRRWVPSRNSWEGGAQGAALHPVLRGPDSLCAGGFTALASGRWRLLLGFFKDGESDTESPKVTEESAWRDADLWNRSFFLRVGVGILTYDCGPRRPERGPRTGAARSPFPAAAPHESLCTGFASLPRPRFRNENSECGKRVQIISALLPLK